MADKAPESGANFFDTVNGGATGYLHRVQESLRTSGVRPNNKKAVEKHLGNEVFTRF